MLSAAGFRRLSAATALSAYLQITLGTTVRVSQSGLGCPDWPLCHGRLYPILDVHSIIEFSHRALGTLTGLLVIATLVFAWRLYRRQRPLVFRLALGAFVAIALEGALGGLVVFNDLSSWLVMAHLTLALAIVGLLAATVLAASPRGGEATVDASYRNLALAAAGLTFVLALTGSSVVASHADGLCKSWPLCRGGLQPDFEGLNAFNMLHRLLGAVVGAVVLFSDWQALRRYRALLGLRRAAAASAALIALQGLVLGPGVAISQENPYWDGLHVATATLVWVATLLVGLIAARHTRAPDRSRRLVLEEARQA
jgi:heme A synthase